MMDSLEFSFDRSVAAEDLHRLMFQSDWGHKRAADSLGTMLSQSTTRLGSWDDEKLVGFARAISDEVYRSVIGSEPSPMGHQMPRPEVFVEETEGRVSQFAARIFF